MSAESFATLAVAPAYAPGPAANPRPPPSAPRRRSITRDSLGQHRAVCIVVPVIFGLASLVVDYVLFSTSGLGAFDQGVAEGSRAVPADGAAFVPTADGLAYIPTADGDPVMDTGVVVADSGWGLAFVICFLMKFMSFFMAWFYMWVPAAPSRFAPSFSFSDLYPVVAVSLRAPRGTASRGPPWRLAAGTTRPGRSGSP